MNIGLRNTCVRIPVQSVEAADNLTYFGSVLKNDLSEEHMKYSICTQKHFTPDSNVCQRNIVINSGYIKVYRYFKTHKLRQTLKTAYWLCNERRGSTMEFAVSSRYFSREVSTLDTYYAYHITDTPSGPGMEDRESFCAVHSLITLDWNTVSSRKTEVIDCPI